MPYFYTLKLLRKVWRIEERAGTTFFMEGEEVYYWSRTVTAVPEQKRIQRR